jgi:hypothetical protein
MKLSVQIDITQAAMDLDPSRDPLPTQSEIGIALAMLVGGLDGVGAALWLRRSPKDHVPKPGCCPAHTSTPLRGMLQNYEGTVRVTFEAEE